MLSETPLYSHVDARLLIPEMALGSPSLAAGDTYTSFNPCCSPEATTACTKTPRQRRCSLHRLLPRSPRRAPPPIPRRRCFRAARCLSPAPLLAGVGRLSRLPAMASHSASQLASGRRRRSPRLAATKAGRWFIHRPGVDGISFTVHPGWL